MRVGSSDQTLVPERVVVHRKFKGQSGGHDLALVKLPSAKGHCLTFHPDTNAACLPSPDTASGGNPPSSCVAVVTASWAGPGMWLLKESEAGGGSGGTQPPEPPARPPLRCSWGRTRIHWRDYIFHLTR